MGAVAERIVGLVMNIPAMLLLSYFIFNILQHSTICRDKTSANTRTESIFTWCSLLSIILFWIQCVLSIIFFCIERPTPQHIIQYGMLMRIAYLVYIMGVILMLLSFVLRIHYTLKGQYLQYSPIVIKILYIMWCILFILSMVMNIFHVQGD
eukprot:368211_1